MVVLLEWSLVVFGNSFVYYLVNLYLTEPFGLTFDFCLAIALIVGQVYRDAKSNSSYIAKITVKMSASIDLK